MKVLRRNCSGTLRVLDVEHSSLVTDAGAEEICGLRRLSHLHAFHTGLTPWGQAAVLRRLRATLRVLVRGDFLCEALEALAAECRERDGDGEGAELPELLLEEFWSSEQYYFHDAEQMELVSKVGTEGRGRGNNGQRIRCWDDFLRAGGIGIV